MSLPNKITIIRICCVPVIVLLLVAERLPWSIGAAMIVFFIASATDFLDGYIARKYHYVTNFGKFLDPVADKLLVLCTFAALVARGWVGCVPLVVLLIRELAVDGLRLVAVEQGKVIAASPLGKLKTVTQILSVMAILHVACGAIPAWLGDVLLAVAVVMTIVSGVDYFIKNRGVLRG